MGRVVVVDLSRASRNFIPEPSAKSTKVDFAVKIN